MFSDRILNNRLEKLRTKENPSLLQELVQIARYSFKAMSPSIMTSERIALGDVTCNNVGQLRKLNQVIFPVNYGDKFYQDVIEAGELAKLGTKKRRYCFFILLYYIIFIFRNSVNIFVITNTNNYIVYYNDVCVGAVCCRKETHGDETQLYMMTLGVLEAYRKLGLGKAHTKKKDCFYGKRKQYN